MDLSNTHHSSGLVGLAITAVTWFMAWAEVVDIALRILLTCVGVVAGIYSLLYYRHRWMRERNRE